MPAMSRMLVVFPGLFLLTQVLYAQSPGADPAAGTPKRAVAVRVGNDAIHVDGRLDEEAWHRAPAISDFVQKEPNEGAPPTERMDVRFAYDDGAIYIGARMYSGNASAIQAPL